MTLEITIDLRAGEQDVDSTLLSRIVQAAADEQFDQPNAWQLGVRVTSDDEICELHERFFGDPSPTDVITFPDSDPGSARGGYLGDVVISADTAREQAAEVGHSAQREIAFLALHGLLHLCGYTDTTPEDRTRMLERQAELLRLGEAKVGSVL